MRIQVTLTIDDKSKLNPQTVATTLREQWPTTGSKAVDGLKKVDVRLIQPQKAVSV